MDPITHGVIGLAVSKLTGNEISFSDAATMSIVVGSVFPDIDIVCQKWGDYAYLKNHRGVTHSIIGLGISSVIIGLFLKLLYADAGIYSLIFWALLGGISHLFFDIFNSYGAKVLWPLSKRKYSLGLIVAFDPVFTGTLIGYLFLSGTNSYVFLSIFVLYLLLRVIMRLLVSKELHKRFGETSRKISLLPSLTGMLRWHFVLEEDDCNIVGEKNVFKSNITIFQRLNKIQDDILDKVLISHVGKFFMEFTPMLHVICESAGGITRYVFIDMRYYTKKDFLHHAVIEMDENDNIINASFNPYSINRISAIPDPSVKSGTLFSRIVGM
jgi:inner membrane protein